MMKIINKNKESAFSLLELLLVVAVGGVLILAGLLIYRNVSTNAEIEQTKRLVYAIHSGVNSLFSNQREYNANISTDITSVVINAGIIPSKYLRNGNVNVLNDKVLTVESAASSNMFRIHIDGLKRSECIKLANTYTNENSDLFHCAVAVGGVYQYFRGFGVNPAATGDCNVENVINRCSQGVDGDIEIMWRIR